MTRKRNSNSERRVERAAAPAQSGAEEDARKADPAPPPDRRNPRARVTEGPTRAGSPGRAQSRGRDTVSVSREDL